MARGDFVTVGYNGGVLGPYADLAVGGAAIEVFTGEGEGEGEYGGGVAFEGGDAVVVGGGGLGRWG